MKEISKEGSVERPPIAKIRHIPIVLVAAACLTALYFLSRSNYLLFHSLAEIFSIIIAFSIFVIAWNSRKIMDNNYFLFIGIAYLFVGGLDLVHTLTYRGMGVFPELNANPATQLWVAARFIESLSLLAATFFISRKFKSGWVLGGYAMVTVLLLVSILTWQNFPTAFVEGTGLTQFKIISEYIIAIITAGAIFRLIKNRQIFSRRVMRLLVGAMVFAIATEMAFTLYADVYGIANMIGHMLKIVSFYLIYKALIETGLNKPYALLFHNLKQSESGLARYAAELSKVNQNLEYEVKERQKAEEALKQFATELQVANKELESFSYTVSHDLRAPLRSLSGFSEAILEDYEDKLDEQGKEYLRHIQSSSQTMSRLINDILNLSRIVRAEIVLNRLNISEIAADVANELKREQPERQVEISIQPGLLAYGDANLLRLVFQNLLGNALKFTAKSPAARIEFGKTEHKGKQAFYVRDNGAGFDMAYADKLFKPFQRLHNDKEYEGTGIGLASIQRIIKRLGGEVWAEGYTGKGATFYFTLKEAKMQDGEENKTECTV
jgi:signal transduction histidine kinase